MAESKSSMGGRDLACLYTINILFVRLASERMDLFSGRQRQYHKLSPFPLVVEMARSFENCD